MSDIYEAVQSGVITYGGVPHTIHKGVTKIRAGHPLLKTHSDMFKPVKVHFDVDEVEEKRRPGRPAKHADLPARTETPEAPGVPLLTETRVES